RTANEEREREVRALEPSFRLNELALRVGRVDRGARGVVRARELRVDARLRVLQGRRRAIEPVLRCLDEALTRDRHEERARRVERELPFVFGRSPALRRELVLRLRVERKRGEVQNGLIDLHLPRAGELAAAAIGLKRVAPRAARDERREERGARAIELPLGRL